MVVISIPWGGILPSIMQIGGANYNSIAIIRAIETTQDISILKRDGRVQKRFYNCSLGIPVEQRFNGLLIGDIFVREIL